MYDLKIQFVTIPMLTINSIFILKFDTISLIPFTKVSIDSGIETHSDDTELKFALYFMIFKPFIVK